MTSSNTTERETSDRRQELFDRIEELRRRIARAAEKCGRIESEIKLVAVSKRFPVEDIAAAMDCGVADFGENRPQELDEKLGAFEDERAGRLIPEFHMIGHLQRNKVNLVVGRCALVHSVDSPRLARAIDARAAELATTQRILVQVNISEEESKFGLEPGTVGDFLAGTASLPNIRVVGLMGMAAYTDDETTLRRQFGSLRELRAVLTAQYGFELPHLSMGMSNDFETAIAEGATIIRVGSLIFGDRLQDVDIN